MTEVIRQNVCDKRMWEQLCGVWIYLLNEKGEHQTETVDHCSENKMKSSHLSLNKETEGNCGLFERLPWSLGPKMKFNILYHMLWLLWVRALQPKHWNFIPLYSSLRWLHCDDSHRAIVSPKPSPREQLAMHERLCIAGNMRGFRGRSHPQSLLS